MYRLFYPLKWTFAALDWAFYYIGVAADSVSDMFGEAADNFRIRIEIAEQRKRGVRVIYVKKVRRDRG
ncbi:hypothetical protein [Bacillus paralicheniformis]|uniref:hypothetical protein n=1 Tax=Bacillus paralicheniformis TaxID=1648923 RepID=UPI0022447F7F|nr:hypothetical protein [Bacillus paralicheniformis]MEC1023553.1 hypothetical protein [Bacillus paralicheniformis]MEC1027421.1 hypothetical protein [Bacillus paralicheniformis]MEC1034385.1 hypothetical protein [Bacillus paralicheniformis]MEC1050233.1 hypothetical protein [Bacillus paralicheniformis]MEC1059830.1 hypothetical protein [Bacillus paralicheniformis]